MKKETDILLKKDGAFYLGQCLEIPQDKGQGNTKAEAIEDTKKAINICKSYLESKKKLSNLVTVSV